MKMQIRLVIFALAVVSLQSCSNPSNMTILPPPPGQLFRMVQGTSMSIQNDTVYDIRYNASGQISSVYDSTHFDSLIASYDAAGNLTHIEDVTTGPSPDFTYAAGLLSEIDYHLGNVHDQYALTYAGEALERIDFKSDLGSGGAVSLQEYFLVNFAGGNIVEARGFSPGDALLTDTRYTYIPGQNVFQKLSLFNITNRMGADELFNLFTFFNSNLLSGYVQSGHAVVSQYTFNSNNQPISVLTNDMLNNKLLTWSFFYQ